MASPSHQRPMLRSRRSALPSLLALAALAALGACDSAESPLAPGNESAASIPVAEPAQTEAVAGGDIAALTTSQRIVFTSARKGGYDIFKMDPQGNNVVRLTTFAKYERNPAWSWDNKRIAMVRPRLDASNVQHSDIYLMNADGSNGHWARSTPFPYNLDYPTWSPDGSRILLTIEQLGKPYLATLTLATGQVKFVTSGGTGVQGDYPSYDPTGKKIAYVTAYGHKLDQVNVDGSGHTTLVDVAAASITSPAFSPDGKRIAFDQNDAGNIDIWVDNFTEGTLKRLTSSPANDWDPTWSPDGSKIAFVSDRSGWSQIWTMTATGGNLVRITHTAATEIHPAWSH
jgi:TolB protein